MKKEIITQGIISTSGTERVSFFVSVDVVSGERITMDALAEALERWASGNDAAYELSHNGAWVTVPIEYVDTELQSELIY